jgi:hypothetical protein
MGLEIVAYGGMEKTTGADLDLAEADERAPDVALES